MTGLPVRPALRVAYLINQYPKVSHSFIRREIHALERAGVEVLRIGLRGWDAIIVDAEDLAEQARTRYVLQVGMAALLLDLMRTALTTPGRFASAFRLALRMARHSDRALAYHLGYLAEACRIVPWLRQSGAAHLHCHFGTNAAEVAMYAQMLGGPPFSFTVHGPEEFDRPEALHLNEKMRRAAFVVAISSFGRSQLYRWLPHSDWAKVRVVHCGLDAGFLAAAPATGSTQLVCVGRLCEQKGQLLLLEAARRLVDRGVAFQLVLAGDGEMRVEVEALIARLDLSQVVRITGWIDGDQVRSEILAARGLVLASFAEGLPVVVMEAMALGRPVLATYVAGIAELVKPAVHGWLVPAGSVGALADAMEALLAASPQTLAQMGNAARRRVMERHSIDVAAARLAILFGQARPPAVQAVAVAA